MTKTAILMVAVALIGCSSHKEIRKSPAPTPTSTPFIQTANERELLILKAINSDNVAMRVRIEKALQKIEKLVDDCICPNYQK